MTRISSSLNQNVCRLRLFSRSKRFCPTRLGVRGYLEPVFSFGAQNGPNEAAAIQGEKRPTPSPLPNPFRTLSEVFPNPWTAAGNDTRQASPQAASWAVAVCRVYPGLPFGASFTKTRVCVCADLSKP